LAAKVNRLYALGRRSGLDSLAIEEVMDESKFNMRWMFSEAKIRGDSAGIVNE